MSEIEKMYLNYQNCAENGADNKKVVEARDTLYSHGDAQELEEYIETLANECEQQGFVNGFKYAMRIIKECNTI